MPGFENVRVLIWEKVWLENITIHVNRTTATFLKRRRSSYLPAYEDGTDRVFRNVGI